MERNSKSVLVVDDDHDLRYILSVRLVSAGYMVYGATNGLEALVQMDKYSVDVVLTMAPTIAVIRPSSVLTTFVRPNL